MEYKENKGTNDHLIITLHGTGGEATDLFGIADYIDPLASKVGFQGEVNENGMNRYFGRYPDGSFDLKSLKNRTDDLYSSIFNFIKDNGYENHMITILGYSNGANIAKNLLKEFKNLEIHNAVLFHPSPITPKINYKNQENLNVFITSGANDPYISEDEFKDMRSQMIRAGINVESFAHSAGHQLIQSELDNTKNFLLSLKGEKKIGKD